MPCFKLQSIIARCPATSHVFNVKQGHKRQLRLLPPGDSKEERHRIWFCSTEKKWTSTNVLAERRGY